MEKSPSSYHRNNTLLVEVINCGKIVVVKILGKNYRIYIYIYVFIYVCGCETSNIR